MKGEWTIKVITHSEHENVQVEKLVNAMSWHLSVAKTFKALGANTYKSSEPKTLLEIYTGENPIAE